MAVTITWNIKNLARRTKDGFVWSAVFTVTGTDGTYKHTVNGTRKFNEPKTLIPYKDLTEDVIVQWVKDNLIKEDPSSVEKIEQNVKNRISEEKAPTVAYGVPWT